MDLLIELLRHNMQFNLNRHRRYTLGSTSAEDNDIIVTDWVNRVLYNSGSMPSYRTQQALTTFVQGLRSTGLMSKMNCINCVVPDNFTASLTPLIQGGSYSCWIPANFTNADLTINGITGNGSTKYIQTGLAPQQAWQGSTATGNASIGMSMYIYNFNNVIASSTAQFELLAYAGGGSQVALLVNYAGGVYFDALNNSTAHLGSRNPYLRGYYSNNCSTLTLDSTFKQAIYIANPLVGHGLFASGSGALGAFWNGIPFFFFAGSSAGTPTSYSSKTISFLAFHYALTQAESTTFFNLVQILRQNLGGGYVDPDPIQDWVSRIIYNGGTTPSTSSLNAVRTFYNTLVSNNLIGKMKVINPFISDNLTASFTPFWNTTGSYDPWINHGFVGSDLTLNGLQGDGTSKYLDSGIIPIYSYNSVDNIGVTLYVQTGSAQFGECEFGGGTNVLYADYQGVTYADLASNTTGSGRITFVNPAPKGYLSANRGPNLSGSLNVVIYAGNATQSHYVAAGQSGVTGGSLYNANTLVFNQTGTGQYSHKRLSFFALHDALTYTQSVAFFNAIQTLRQNLGGGYV